MEPLWAPWRMEFIRAKPTDECIFCVKPGQEERLRENLILSRGQHSFVILNRFPYANGHLLVVPYRHVSEYDELTTEELAEMDRSSQESVRILRKVCAAQGFNMGMNLGRAAGAGIADHLHQHVVPRWVGDTNFMPVVGSTRTLPEHILATYDQLLEHYGG